MRVAVLHNAVPADASAADRDVLVQAAAVLDALECLGHEGTAIACSLDLGATGDQLRRYGPDVVFNLVESLGGSDWLMSLAPALLDTLGLPYAGVPTEGFFLASHKLLTKERLCQAGVPTPPWVASQTAPIARSPMGAGQAEPALRPPYIIKAIREHASFGLDEESVVHEGHPAPLAEVLATWSARLGRPCFAEQYVEGREFNLSVLGGPQGPEVLPPAEIDFSAFPPGKTRVVGQRAKWEDQSFEYSHTPPHFDFPPADQPLLDRLAALARQCWDLFGLRGWARVDFRVDAGNQPWVLEINANPCLSPDAGFPAALKRAGIPFPQAIQRILGDCPNFCAQKWDCPLPALRSPRP